MKNPKIDIDEFEKIREDQRQLENRRRCLIWLFKIAAEKHREYPQSNPFLETEMDKINLVYPDKECTLIICSPEVSVTLEITKGFEPENNYHPLDQIIFIGKLHKTIKCLVDCYGYRQHILFGFGIDDVDAMMESFNNGIVTNEEIESLYPYLTLSTIKDNQLVGNK